MKSIATNSTGMKLHNRRLILNIIRRKPVSRAELARITGLTRAAVTLIVDDLIKSRVLFETGTAEADFGRKPLLLDINPDSFYAVGISIVRDGCNIGIMNIKGEILENSRVDLDESANANENIKSVVEVTQKIVTKSKLPFDKFLGIGISAPGPVDINDGTILNPPNFDMWHNVAIVKEFRKTYDLPVFLENNSTSLAYAEKNYGRGVKYRSFILMVVDVGIGSGIVINDDIYRGVGGFGSEIGHASICFDGKPCSCGNRGCLEVYASIPVVIEDMRKYGKDVGTWKEIVDKASDGDEICIKAIENEALYLSTGIVNIMNILELEAVILSGDIQYRPELLLDLIRRNTDSTAITRRMRKSNIMTSSIIRDPEVISSASIIFERYFRGDI